MLIKKECGLVNWEDVSEDWSETFFQYSYVSHKTHFMLLISSTLSVLSLGTGMTFIVAVNKNNNNDTSQNLSSKPTLAHSSLRLCLTRWSTLHDWWEGTWHGSSLLIISSRVRGNGYGNSNEIMNQEHNQATGLERRPFSQ